MLSYTSFVTLALVASLGGLGYSLWKLHLVYRELTAAQTNLNNELTSKTIAAEQLAKLEADKDSLETKVQLANESKNELSGELKTLKESKVSAEQMKQQLRESFQAIGNEISLSIAEQTKRDAKGGISTVIDPFKQTFAQEAAKLKDLVEQTAKSFAEGNEKVSGRAELASTSAKTATEEVVKLTKLLRGDVQRQGRWGEVQLERVLETSGLIKDIGYKLQVTSDERDKRADCLFCFPDGKRMVIDSKVMLEAYEKWLGSEKRAEREAAQKEFTASIKTQITNLAKKQYPKLYRRDNQTVLDWVIMFVPNEAALGLAMQDKELWSYASAQKIVFAGPSTLLMIADAVNQVWKYSEQNQTSAQAIAVAETLLSKIEGFIEATEKIGASLGKAQQDYEKAQKILFSGRGNLRQKCEKLLAIGLEPPKRKLASAKSKPLTELPVATGVENNN